MAGRTPIDASAGLFLRGLGLVHAIAHASLAVQAAGLWGPGGVLPAGEVLAVARRVAGEERFLAVPTLCWWVGTSASALQALAWTGTLLGVLLLLGRGGRPVLLALWAIYLSLASVGGPFMAFQWDALLLEVTLVALLLPDGRGGAWRPAWVSLRLVHLKLMVMSGIAKLASGDPRWRDLSALEVHFETQPLPNPLSWAAHQLPDGLLAAATAAMFVLELAVPWLILGPRPARAAALAGSVLLMGVIAATGNYGWFNLLTVVLALSALDDRMLGRPPARERAARRRPLAAAALAALAALQVGVVLERHLPASAQEVLARVAPFRSVNRYGLFADMTVTRPEIVLEATWDGSTWTPIPFRWKPQDPYARPRQVAPHMPRLDWQMWFAALGSPRRNLWLVRLVARLLEGVPEVWALLGRDGLPPAPPSAIRARRVRLRFTDPAARARTGAWWFSEPLGSYLPPLTLDRIPPAWRGPPRPAAGGPASDRAGGSGG